MEKLVLHLHDLQIATAVRPTSTTDVPAVQSTPSSLLYRPPPNHRLVAHGRQAGYKDFSLVA